MATNREVDTHADDGSEQQLISEEPGESTKQTGEKADGHDVSQPSPKVAGDGRPVGDLVSEEGQRCVEAGIRSVQARPTLGDRGDRHRDAERNSPFTDAGRPGWSVSAYR